MKKCTFYVFSGMVLLLGFVTPSRAMQSANYRIEPMVLTSGGGVSSSVGIRAFETMGQPTPVGVASSASYRLLSGFWYQLLRIIQDGDVNGDGHVDLLDAVLSLQILSNLPSYGIVKDADADGDHAVGLPEVIYILQRVGSMR